MAAITLAEAQKLAVNDLQAGVIESLITRSPILEKLPFLSYSGDNFEFNRENSRGTASWEDPDAELSSQASTFTNVTVGIKYMYRLVDVPHPIQMGLSRATDQTKVQMDEAMLAVRDEFLDTYYYGVNSTNTKTPDGLHTLVDNITVPTGATRPRVQRASGSTNQGIRLQDFDNMMFTLMKRGVDLITMHSTVFRLMQAASRSTSVTGTIQYVLSELGKALPSYNGVMIGIDDAIRVTETAASGAYSTPTGSDGTSVFFHRFGDTYQHGLQQTAGPTVDGPFELHNKDSVRLRIKWYVTPAVLRSLYSCGKIDGILNTTAVVA